MIHRRYCYKVVIFSQFTSHLTGLHDPDVIYQTGDWTEPPKGCGPLCVFDTLANAKKFVKNYYSYCEKRPNLLIYSCVIEPSQLKQVWWCKVNDPSMTKCFPIPLTFLPHGTVLASRVRLLPGGLISCRAVPGPAGVDSCFSCFRDAICGCEKL